jgi:hypothetical protein
MMQQRRPQQRGYRGNQGGGYQTPPPNSTHISGFMPSSWEQDKAWTAQGWHP